MRRRASSPRTRERSARAARLDERTARAARGRSAAAAQAAAGDSLRLLEGLGGARRGARARGGV